MIRAHIAFAVAPLALASTLAVVVVAASGCPAAVDCGGLSTAPPDVPEGKGTATRTGVGAGNFDDDASWAPGTLADVTIGALSMTIPVDITGTSLDSLVSDGAFPICIALATHSEQAGDADLLEGNTFVTDDSHTGNVLVTKVNGDLMTGRFKADLVSADGASTVSFADGAFQARRRAQ